MAPKTAFCFKTVFLWPWREKSLLFPRAQRWWYGQTFLALGSGEGQVQYWGLATLTAFGEKLAIEHLGRQDIKAYSPQFMDRRIKRGRVFWTPASLFPGYLFVGVCDRFRSIFGTKGISNLLMDGIAPMRVRSEEIEKIKALEVDGYVLLPSLPKFSSPGKFAYGDKVVSTQWPTAVGVYRGQRKADRVKVLYQMLGAEREIYIREGDLTAA